MRAVNGVMKARFEALETRLMFSAPHVTASSFDYETLPHKVKFTFDQDVSASLSASDLSLQTLGSSDAFVASDKIVYSYDSATNTATFKYMPSGSSTVRLPDKNYRAALSAADVTNAQGERLDHDAVLDFFFFQGDVNHDRVVNNADMTVIQQHDGQSGTYSQGDLDYSGTIDATIDWSRQTDGVWYEITADTSLAASAVGPDGLTIIPTSTTENTISWVDRTQGEGGYQILRSTDGGETFDVLTTAVAANATSYVDAVPAGTHYWYKVRASGNGKDSAYTPKRNDSFAALDTPVAPVVSDPQENSLTVSWTYPTTSGVDGFEILRSRGANGAYSLYKRVDAGTFSTTVSGLVAETDYHFKVRATGPDAVSDYSSAGSGTTASGPLHVLTGEFDYGHTPHALNINFDHDISQHLSPNDNFVTNLTTNAQVDPSWMSLSFANGSDAPSFTFPGYTNSQYAPKLVLRDGNYESILNGDTIQDSTGQLLGNDVNTEFFFLRGDVNHDRAVDTLDFNSIVGNFGHTNATFGEGDVNFDESIDTGDFNVFAGMFGAQLPQPLNDQNQLSATRAGVDDGYSQLLLTWTPPSGVHDGYRIWRADDGVNYLQVAEIEDDTPATETNPTRSWTDHDLLEGKKYTYRIRPFTNANGDGESTNKYAAVTALHAASDVNADQVTATSALLRWTDNSNGEAGFRIEWSSDGGSTYGGSQVVSGNHTGVGVMQTTLTGLTPNTAYLFRVVVFTPDAESAPTLPCVVSTPLKSGEPAAIVGPDAAEAGTWIQLTGSGGNPNGGSGPLTYIWRIERDGKPFESDEGTSISFLASAQGTYTADLIVLGDIGGPATAPTHVINVGAPTMRHVSISGPEFSQANRISIYRATPDITWDDLLGDDVSEAIQWQWTAWKGAESVPITGGDFGARFSAPSSGTYTIRCEILVKGTIAYRGDKTVTVTTGSSDTFTKHKVDEAPFSLWGEDAVELPNGKILALYSYSNWTDEQYPEHNVVGFVERLNQDLSLDTSWANHGRTMVVLPANGDSTTFPLTNIRVALQEDGKFLIPLTTSDGWYILRYNADGSPDQTFGPDGDGHVLIGHAETGHSLRFVHAITLQPDGKILLGGDEGSDFPSPFVVTRLNTDGSLDESFGPSGGTVTVWVTPPEQQSASSWGFIESVYSLRIQPVGNDFMILAGGTAIHNEDFPTRDTRGGELAMIRLTRTGELDTNTDSLTPGDGGFGPNGNGIVTTNKTSPPPSNEELPDAITDIALTRDNQIIAIAGVAERYGASWSSINPFDSPGSGNLLIAKYDTNGLIDSSFGGNGTGEWRNTFYGQDIGWAGFVDDLGNIIVGGGAPSGGLIARFTPAGIPDTSFGDGGGYKLVGTDDDPSTPGYDATYALGNNYAASWSNIIFSQARRDYILVGTAVDPDQYAQEIWDPHVHRIGVAARYQPPAAPVVGELTATATPSGPIDLAWTNLGSGEDGFEIRRAASEVGLASASALTFVGPNETKYHDIAVEPNTTYFYQVRSFTTNHATGAIQLGSPSNPAHATTAPTNTGYVLQDTIALPISGASRQSQLSLQAAKNYLISATGYFAIDQNSNSTFQKHGDAEWGRFIPTPDADSVTPVQIKFGVGINDLDLGLNRFPYWGDPTTTLGHQYTISYTPDGAVPVGSVGGPGPLTFNYHDSYYADNEVGEPIQITIYRALPSSPATLTAEADRANKRMELAWQNLATDATRVLVERREDDGAFMQIASLAPGATMYTDTSALLNHKYTYRVRARSTFGDSGYSNEAFAVLVNLPPSVPTIAPQVARLDEEFRLRLDATDPEDGESGLTFAVINPLPDMVPTDANRNTTGEISGWTPTGLGELGVSHVVHVRVWDQDGAYVDQHFSVTVAPASDTLPTVIEQAHEILASRTDTTVTLKVVADDDGGEANLKYTWSVASRPVGAPLPTFAGNGTHAASQVVATPAAAGGYKFRVTISDGTEWPTTSDTETITVDQKLSSVSVTPVLTTLSADSTQRLTSLARDQFSRPMSTVPTFAWAIDPGGAAGALDSISGTSVAYTAPSSIAAPESDQITVTATLSPGVTAVGHALVNLVAEANQAPDVEELADADALNSSQLRLTVLGSDPDGPESELSYTWGFDPPGAGIPAPTFSVNGSNSAKTTIANCSPDHPFNYTFHVIIRDKWGAETESSVAVTDQRNFSQVVVTPRESNVGVGKTQTYTAEAQDHYGRKVLPQPPFTWRVGPDIVSGLTGDTFTYTAPATAGDHVITAEATVSGVTNTGTANVTVVAAGPPVMKILSPGAAYGQAATLIESDSPVKIVAADPDGDAVEWALWLIPSDGTRMLVASGNSPAGQAPATPEQVATIRASHWADGLYNLQLTSSIDNPDTTIVDSKYVQIRSLLKLGNLALPFTDLQVDDPSGGQVALTRDYDSMQSAVKGDFGYGWRMNLSKPKVRTTVTPTPGKPQDESGMRLGDLVYITLPSGGEQVFQFLPKAAGTDSFGQVFFTPQFVAVDGSSSKLSIAPTYTDEEGTTFPIRLVLIDGVYVEETTRIPYNPANPTLTGTFGNRAPIFGNYYEITSRTDKSKLTIEASTGNLLESLDANGNATTLTDPTNVGITVERLSGTQGGITDGLVKRVKDNNGQYLRYGYDPSTADLIGMIDRVAGPSNTKLKTTFSYADELVTTAGGSNNVYAILSDSSGKVWNGTGFVTVNGSDWASYAVTMTSVADPSDPNSTEWHVTGVPSAIPSGTSLMVSYRMRAGASAAQTDPEVDSETNRWTAHLPHYLTIITDSRGVRSLAAQYDPSSGQLTKVSDATGKAAPVSDGGVNGKSKTVSDALGNKTEEVFDDYGNLVREIRAVTENGKVTKYIVTVHEYHYGDDPNMQGAIANGVTNFNKLSIQKDWQPFEVPVSNAAARYTQEPTPGTEANVVVYNLHDAGDVNVAAYGLWMPNSESTAGPNGLLTTTYAYDAHNHLSQSTDAHEKTTFYQYDDAGNLLWSINPNGEGTEYTYTSGTADLPAGLLSTTRRIKSDQTDLANRPVDPIELTGDVETTNEYYANTPSTPLGSRGKLKSTTTQATAAKTVYAYDSFGNSAVTATLWKNPTSGQLDRWVVSRSVFDASHRVIETREAVYTDSGSENVSDGELAWLPDGSGNVVINEPVYKAERTLSSTQYNALRQVESTQDEYGLSSYSHFDDRGQVVETVNADDTVTRTVYDAAGRVILATDRFNPNKADPVQATRTIYDSLGRVVETQRVSGLAVMIAQDVSNAAIYRVTAVSGAGAIPDDPNAPANGVWKLDPNFTSYLSHSRTIYNSQGQVVESVDSAGLRMGTIYYGNGAVKVNGILTAGAPSTWFTASSPEAYFTSKMSYAYDQRDDNMPSGAVSYDMTTDPRGMMTRSYHDAAGSVFKTEQDNQSANLDPSLRVSSANEITISGRSDRPATYPNLTITLPDDPGLVDDFPSTFDGQHVVKLDQLGNQTNYLYDSLGRLTDVWLPPVPDAKNGGIATWPHWHYQYDASGNQKSQTDPNHHTTAFTYDEQGRRTSRTLPAINNTTVTETWSYDDFGRVRLHKDFKGQTTWYKYDNTREGRLVAEYRYATDISPGTSDEPDSFSTGYDEKTMYVYDDDPSLPASLQKGLGRCTVVREYGARGNGAVVREETTEYDPITGQISKITSPEGVINHAYDPATGRLVRTWTVNNDTAYRYDSHGRLFDTIAIVLNGNRFGTYIGLDSSGNPIVNNQGTAMHVLQSFDGYDISGNLDWTLYDNGTAATSDDIYTDYVYDGLERLKQEIVLRGCTVDQTTGVGTGGTSIFTQNFVLNSDGTRHSVEETREGGWHATMTWDYDADGRLTQEHYDPSDDTKDYTATYSFDLVGNRVKKVQTGFEAMTTVYAYNDRDQLTDQGPANSDDVPDALTKTHFSYDANGSTAKVATPTATTGYVWDLRNRLVGYDANGDDSLDGSSDVRYGYDGQGTRISKSLGAAQPMLFLIDYINPTGYSQVLEERNSTAASPPTRSYVLGIDVIAQATTTALQAFLYDGHSSTRALLDAAGHMVQGQVYAYDAYGIRIDENTGIAAATSLLYTGEWWDNDSAQQFLRARWYAPSIGRFTAVDPYGGDPSRVATLNKYLYAGDDPIQFLDPSGRSFISELGTEIHKGVYDLYRGSHGGPKDIDVDTSPEGVGGAIRPDIVDYNLHEIVEIKPLSLYGVATGHAQLFAYLKAYNGVSLQYNGNKIDIPPVDGGGWSASKWAVGIQPIPIKDPYFADWVAFTLTNVAGVVFYKAVHIKSITSLTVGLLKQVADRLDEDSRLWRRQFEDSMRGQPFTAPKPNPGLVVAFNDWLDNEVHSLTTTVSAAHLSKYVGSYGGASILALLGIGALLELSGRTA